MTGHFRSPDKLLRELSIGEPKQIDVEAIAQYCRATITYEPLQGCAARILAFGDRAIITIDSVIATSINRSAM